MGAASQQPAAELGARLRAARRQRGMSQAEVGGSDYSVSYVSLVENGKRTPTAEALAVLAGRVGLDPAHLATGQRPVEDEQPRLDLRFAQLSLVQGEAHDAVRRLELLHAQAGRFNPDHDWDVAYALAKGYEMVGDLRAAVLLLEELAERALRVPERWPWIEVNISLTRCYRGAGDLRRAIDVGEAALQRAHELSPELVALLPRLVATIAMAYIERGDLTRAQQLLDAALVQAEGSGSRVQRGSVLWNCSIVAAERGQHGEAVQLADRALVLIAEETDARSLARLRGARAWVELCHPDGDVDRALHLLSEARTALLDCGTPDDLAAVETELARAELLRDRPGRAVEHARSALRRLGDQPHIEAAVAHLYLGKGLLAQGDRSCGQAHMAEAGTIIQSCQADRQAAQVWRELAELQEGAGQSEQAADSFRRALDTAGIRSLTGGPRSARDLGSSAPVVDPEPVWEPAGG